MANQDFNRSLYVGISLILGDKTRKVIKREQLPMEWVLYYTLNFLCEDSYHLATQAIYLEGCSISIKELQKLMHVCATKLRAKLCRFRKRNLKYHQFSCMFKKVQCARKALHKLTLAFSKTEVEYVSQYTFPISLFV